MNHHRRSQLSRSRGLMIDTAKACRILNESYSEPTEGSLETKLSDYINATSVLPWIWGVQDCTMWAADWCIIRWGFDPAAEYRGRYSSELEALSIIRDGLSFVVSPSLSRLQKKDLPDAGDVGIVDIKGNNVSAIRCGKHWAFKTPSGIGFTRLEASRIWGD